MESSILLRGQSSDRGESTTCILANAMTTLYTASMINAGMEDGGPVNHTTSITECSGNWASVANNVTPSSDVTRDQVVATEGQDGTDARTMAPGGSLPEHL